MNVTTKAQAKTLVSSLRRQFKDLLGMSEVPSHTTCLELMAKTMGFKTWNEWDATLLDVAASPVAAPKVAEAWSPARGPMSERQYAASEGLKCPVCGDEHAIEGFSWNADAGYATQEMNCSACETSWIDNYALNGFTFESNGRQSFDSEEAKENGFVYALKLWLLGDTSELNEDNQEILDDMVVDAVVNGALPDVNGTASSDGQDDAIADAEASASDINNRGLIAQLAFLVTADGNRESTIALLEEKFELNRSTLIL